MHQQRRQLSKPNVLLITCIGISLGVVLMGTAHADRIVLKSGQTVEGKIISQDDKKVILNSSINAPITYYRDEIAEITLAPFADPASNADKMENEAVALIDEGKREAGLAKLIKAIELDPTPLRRMNFGSVLFGDGVEAYKKGDLQGGISTLRRCEKELLKAIEGFAPANDSAYISQCYFLLGEMYAHAFNDRNKANEYYTKALDNFDHPAAREALENLNTKAE